MNLQSSQKQLTYGNSKSLPSVEKMEISYQDSSLALVAPILHIYTRWFAHLWNVYRGQNGWSVIGALAQGRDSEETTIVSSPQFLVRN